MDEPDSAVESGMAMGYGVAMEDDPLADLMDSMEELSLEFEETEEKEIAERQLGDASRTPSVQIIQTWMRTLPDMPGANFLRRTLRTLRSADQQPTVQDLLEMLDEGSDDPSHQFAMLDCLENSLTAEARATATERSDIRYRQGRRS